MRINNQPAARAGDAVTCAGPPNELSEGSEGVFVNGQSLARAGDAADHGGPVVLGSPNVLVGERGGGGTTASVPPSQAIQPINARLDADYDRNRSVTPGEYSVRVLRPGHVLLANLDIDGPTRPRGSRIGHRDGEQSSLNPDDDDTCSIELAVDGAPSPGDHVRLTLHALDQRRIRIFDGRSQSLVLGGGAQGQTTWVQPVSSLPVSLTIDATTLPGDPRNRAPRGNVPGPLSAQTQPAEQPERRYRRRASSEIWIDLTQPGRPGRDFCLFTIAPFLLVPNTQPVERLFMSYDVPQLPGRFTPTQNWYYDGNHNAVYELCEVLQGLWGAGQVDLPASPSESFRPHDPQSTKKVYLVAASDLWMQDQLCFGYCWAPHGWMNVAVHCKRSSSQLEAFVRNDLARKDIGLFDHLQSRHDDSVEFGGNIEVSPPVMQGTARMRGDEAGPRVPAHPPAPFGKIILGDCHPRPVSPEVREFFLAQGVQPILPIDTSWLAVGHVDEIMTTVPDRNAGGQAFRLLVADTEVMDAILERVAALPFNERTGFHRGKYAYAGGRWPYGELQVEDLTERPYSQLDPDERKIVHMAPLPGSTSVSIRGYNASLQAGKLAPICKRLQRGLGLAGSDVIRVPVYFKLPVAHSYESIHDRRRNHTTVALTVGSVNLQLVDDRALVPRPWGPRVKPNEARRILNEVLPGVGLGHLQPQTPPSGLFTFWCPPGQRAWRLGAYFLAGLSEQERRELVKSLRNVSSIDPGAQGLDFLAFWASPSTALLQSAVAGAFQDIKSRNPVEMGGIRFDGTSAFSRWTRITVAESPELVDILEAYWLTVLRPLGLQVHFIDDWLYHELSGEVHCGTNTIRRPMELNEPARWWDHYDPERDLRYDPRHIPNP